MLYYVCVMTRSYLSNKQGPCRNRRCFMADTTSPFNSTLSTKSTKPSTAVACLSPSSSVQSSFVNKKNNYTTTRPSTIHGSKPQHSCFLKTAL